MRRNNRITITAMILVVSILLSVVLGGCSNKESAKEDVKSKVVVTMGEYTLTNSQLQVCYWMQLYEMLNYYGTYAEYILGIDLSKPLQDQVRDSTTGQTWHDYLLEVTLDTWHRYQSTYAEAKKANYQLPVDEQQELAGMRTELQDVAMQKGFESVDAMIQSQYGKDVTFEDYYHCLEVRCIAEAYFSQVVSELEFTDAEMEEYFTKNEADLAKYGITKDTPNLVDFRNIFVKAVTSKDENGKTVITDKAWAACLEKAQGIFDTWDASEKEVETFAGLAKIKSEDTKSASSGGLYTYVAKNEWATVDVRHILVMPKGGTKDTAGNVIHSEEEWETCRAEAQKLLDEYLAGAKTEDAFGALANEHSEDQEGKVTNGGLYANVTAGQMVREFDDWIFDDSRTPGETGLVKTEFGYHVMYFVRRNGPVDAWLFDEDRKVGDYEMIKTDDGYQIVYYVDDSVAWEVWCERGLKTETNQKLMDSYMENNPKTVLHDAIAFGEAPKLK